MQCKHCGSIIRDNVKYCTMCGKSVFEIRNSIINNETTDKMKEQVVNVGNKVADNVKNVSNKVAENIKNIDTDKMKEQFRNVSNNVVENVKNFDKEQAKQKTMNFASNVKTDVKNFKTLSTTKKRNYIIALVVIILVVFVAGKGIMGIGGNSAGGNSAKMNSKMTEIAQKYEDAAWKYTGVYSAYNQLSNGNTVYLIQYKSVAYSYKMYVLVELSKKDNSVVKRTDKFSDDVSTSLMYSSKWR